MKFLCLGYGDEKGWDGMSPSEQAEAIANDGRLRSRGDTVGAVAPATVVRVWGGKPEMVRGPSLERTRPAVAKSLIVVCRSFIPHAYARATTHCRPSRPVATAPDQ